MLMIVVTATSINGIPFRSRFRTAGESTKTLQFLRSAGYQDIHSETHYEEKI